MHFKVKMSQASDFGDLILKLLFNFGTEDSVSGPSESDGLQQAIQACDSNLKKRENKAAAIETSGTESKKNMLMSLVPPSPPPCVNHRWFKWWYFDLLAILQSWCFVIFFLDSYQFQLLLLPSARCGPRGAGSRLLADGIAIVVQIAAFVFFKAPLRESRGRGRVLLIAVTTEKLSEVVSLVDPWSPGLAESRHSCLDADERKWAHMDVKNKLFQFFLGSCVQCWNESEQSCNNWIRWQVNQFWGAPVSHTTATRGTFTIKSHNYGS